MSYWECLLQGFGLRLRYWPACLRRSSLWDMFDVARECANKLDLRFNGAKSQYIVMDAAPSSVPVASIRFCGVDVPRVESGLHLGNVLGLGSNSKSIAKGVSDLNQRTNVILSRFPFCPPEVRYALFRSHCMIAYGSQLWDFDSEAIRKFFTSWRINVRRLWRLPRTTHCSLLPGVCNDRADRRNSS